MQVPLRLGCLRVADNDYITRTTKQGAINAAKKGVKRPEIMSAWVEEENVEYDPFRCYIYKGDKHVTDQTGW